MAFHGPMSDSHKAKIGLANEGRIFTAEHCAKLSAAKLGRKDTPKQTERKRQIMAERYAAGWKPWEKDRSPEELNRRSKLLNTPEIRKRAVEARMKNGYTHSQETRQKMRISKLGFNNPRWKGGVTSEQKLRRHSAEYRQWREFVFKRDDFTCMMSECGKRGGKLNANHIKPFSTHKELRLIVSNGITLCVPCHQSIRGKEMKFKKQFIQVIGATGNN